MYPRSSNICLYHFRSILSSWETASHSLVDFMLLTFYFLCLHIAFILHSDFVFFFTDSLLMCSVPWKINCTESIESTTEYYATTHRKEEAKKSWWIRTVVRIYVWIQGAAVRLGNTHTQHNITPHPKSNLNTKTQILTHKTACWGCAAQSKWPRCACLLCVDRMIQECVFGTFFSKIIDRTTRKFWGLRSRIKRISLLKHKIEMDKNVGKQNRKNILN